MGILRRRNWLVLLALLLSLGCSGKGPRGDISGTVTYFGKPLPRGSSVTFLNAENNQVGSSIVSDEGTYSMANVPAGPMRITVTTFPSDLQGAKRRMGGKKKGVPPPPPPLVLPAKYSDPNQSGLTYTVQPAKQEFNIELP